MEIRRARQTGTGRQGISLVIMFSPPPSRSPPVTQQSVCVRERGATRCFRERRHRELPPPPPPPGPGGKQPHTRSYMRVELQSVHTLSLSSLISHSCHSVFHVICPALPLCHFIYISHLPEVIL